LKARSGRNSDQPIDRQILELFRERNSTVSGAELSGILKVSRTAVWKHITTLRNQGYLIESRHATGYRLLDSPDLLTPASVTAGLATKRLGKQVICLPETGSTNVDAYRLAEDGAAEGAVILADSQNQGKGRLGRSWHSPPGLNIYCSLVLRPPIPPIAAFHLTFLSAVAVARTIEAESSLKPVIKWPNDILVNGSKVAGLLNEMSAETEQIKFVILGIGVNLNMKQEHFPSDLRHPATSLCLEGKREQNRLKFVRTLLATLDDLYDRYLCSGYDAIREEWVARCGMIGRRVTVGGPNEQMEGVATGIDENGALLVEQDNGILARVFAGDVKII
jgi:BirA family biotin operon repressor/biotin-[acetyl-CoA-carboxylase] ligase